MAQRNRRTWGSWKIFLVFMAFLIAVSYLDVVTKDNREVNKAVIFLDPLYPQDPGYHDEIIALFEEKGYRVDSYIGEDVTVELLRRNKNHYKVWLLRVHSTVNNGMVWVFTGETASSDKYILEQLADEVHPARPSLSSDHLFAVGSDFVRHFMNNMFKESTILVMGCDGLSTDDFARAFTDNEAKAYVSWDGPVSLDHTDDAFLCFLTAHVSDGLNVSDSVRYTMDMVGCDPDYNSTLTYFSGG
ncbi:MAG: hypothetical protein NWE89_12795 [Candidatus Bathyarchaeota archaeon]|nr:hypothetical protein [Candidatus Bathyarchaeota archaeon]